MAKSLEEWKKSVFNRAIDLDNQSFDCVDVSKHWIQYLTDVSWTKSAGWGNAKDIYANWSSTYLSKIPRGNAPKLGDIVVMNGTVGGGYGHTGVVVKVDGNNITIYQQNTFTQQPIYTGVFNAYTSYITGFLRPKVSFSTGSSVKLEPYQRIVAPGNVKYRTGAGTNYPEMQESFKAGETINFKGYVKGQSIDGNNIWFVGRFTGGYSWSGGFTDKSTKGLSDLTPTKLESYQRQVGDSVINYRTSPYVKPENVIRTFPAGEILDFDAWTKGSNVDGTDVWFRGKYTGGWSHAGGFTDQTTKGLTQVSAVVQPTPPEPVYPSPTTDPLVTKIFNKKNAINKDYAPTDLVKNGGQYLRKEANDSMKLMQAQQDLIMASGYRSYATQEKVYNKWVSQLGQAEADRVSARPGHSEHQTGLTMDFGPIDVSFENTEAYKWLTSHAYKYGWVLRYPHGKESITGYVYEPWHWRYVGVEIAKELREKGIITLEEHFNVEGGDYPDNPAPVDPTVPTDPPVDPTEPTDPTYPEDPVNNPLFKILESIVNFLQSIINRLKK